MQCKQSDRKAFYLPNLQAVDSVTTGVLGCLIAELLKDILMVFGLKMPHLSSPCIFILKESEKKGGRNHGISVCDNSPSLLTLIKTGLNVFCPIFFFLLFPK